jgi:DNA-binding NarL/FixJ family response regulator
MAQWSVQLVIGRLLTDAPFRQRFERERSTYLDHLRERGLELTDAEIAALVEAEPHVWTVMASRIDQRLLSAVTGVDRWNGGLAHRLTDRQRLVLEGVFDGLTNKQIAAAVGVSEGAIKATLQHLFRKTHVRSRAQLVRVALDHALDDLLKRR